MTRYTPLTKMLVAGSNALVQFSEDLGKGMRREGTRLGGITNHGPAVLYWPLGVIVDEEWQEGKLTARTLRTSGQLLEKVKVEGHRPAVKAELEKLVGELDTVMLVNVKCPFLDDSGVYVGHVQDNKYHGKGLFVSDGGGVYAGDFYEGQYHGVVVVYYPSGRIYDETWNHNNRTSSNIRHN